MTTAELMREKTSRLGAPWTTEDVFAQSHPVALRQIAFCLNTSAAVIALIEAVEQDLIASEDLALGDCHSFGATDDALSTLRHQVEG